MSSLSPSLSATLAQCNIAAASAPNSLPSTPLRRPAATPSIKSALSTCFNTIFVVLADPEPSVLQFDNIPIRPTPIDLAEQGVLFARRATQSAYAAVRRAAEQAEIANQLILRREAEWHHAVDYLNRYQAGLDLLREMKMADGEKALQKKDERIAERKRKRDDTTAEKDDRTERIRAATAPRIGY